MKQPTELHESLELLAVQTTGEFDAEYPNRQEVTGVRPLVPMVPIEHIHAITIEQRQLREEIERLKAENEELRTIANTGIVDKNGIMVKLGDTIRESHTYNSDKANGEYDIAFGVIRYIRGCHVIDFRPLNDGRFGVYTLYDRHPVSARIQNRVWQIVDLGYEIDAMLGFE